MNNRDILKRVLRYIDEYRMQVVMSLACALVSVVPTL